MADELPLDEGEGEEGRTHLLSPDRFKYKVLQRTFDSPGEFVRSVNFYGYRGWQVIDLDRDDKGQIVEVIFARRQPVEPTEGETPDG